MKDNEVNKTDGNNSYRKLVESLFDALLLFRDNKLVCQNEIANNLFGYTEIENLGQQPEFWFCNNNVNETSFLPDGTNCIEQTGIKKDGTRFPVLLRQKLIIQDNIPFTLLSVSDISSLDSEKKKRKTDESQLQQLFNIIPVMMHSISKEGRIIYVTDYWLEKMGYTREEVIGKEVFELFTASSRKYAKEYVLPNFLKKGFSKNIEYEWVKKNGKIFSSLLTAVALYDDNGEFINSLAVTVDISDRKKAEQKLQDLYQQQQALIEAIPDLIIFKDGEGKWLYTNEPVKKIFNLYDKEWAGKTSTQLWQYNNTQQIDALESADEEDESAWQSAHTFISYKTLYNEFGTERLYEFRKVPIFEADGKRKAIITIATDITERKAEEERLKLLETAIDNATDAITITKINATELHQSRVIYVNKASSDMSGYKREELIGRTPRFLQGREADSEILKSINEVINKGEAYSMEMLDYRKNGDAFWSTFTITPVSIGNQKNSHWIGIKRDTTDRKMMELELVKAKEKAEAGSRAKSEFLANMSHEIRTPLNSVIGFSDLLLKSKLNDRQQQYISAVYQSANALIEIINGILDFSKIEAGKLEIDIDKTDILELGEQIVYLISIQASKKNLEILLNIAPDVPRFAWIDAVRIRQVLINLLGNAVKFTTTGEVELKIELVSKVSNSRSILRFSVRDTGVGIDPANQTKIFEAFEQEDSSINRKFGGTGLGLAISKRLISLMGGNLILDSTVGIGSCFSFELNVKSIHGEAAEWTNISNIQKVLIVDDNANNRNILKDMMAIKHIETDEAENGLEAIHLIEQGKKYDVILIDYHMPVMDGLSAIRKMRKELRRDASIQPVILFHSSADDEQIHAACKSLDIKQHLVKPIKMKQLFEALAKIGTQNKKSTEDELESTGHFSSRYEFCKVLVVDDNAFNILLIKTVISEILPNARITEAIDGKDALKKYKESRPDIIFMDIQMPEMNGYDATRSIRELESERQVPIIALTAGTLKEEKEKCMEAGMNDYVSKPYVINTVVDILNKWLPV